MNNLISLFSGAGGLDLGFKKAGFNIVWANEYDKNVWETHKLNFPDTELSKESIVEINEKKLPDCVGMIGGPPCQSFSEAGAKRGTKDARGQLFWDYIRILKEKKPKFFVAENVSGLLSKKHKPDLDAFLKEFNETGYEVSTNLYKASDYGVAQDRERLIFIGYRKDLGKKPGVIEKIDKKITLKDIIANMPNPVGVKSGQAAKSLNIPNHEYMLGTFSSMFMSRNRVRTWEESSFTILATARQTPLHPQAPKMVWTEKDKFEFKKGKEKLYRRLSVRECARIQSFPEDFIFKYDKIENGYKMVGNAVPVQMAYLIAAKIMKDLF